MRAGTGRDRNRPYTPFDTSTRQSKSCVCTSASAPYAQGATRHTDIDMQTDLGENRLVSSHLFHFFGAHNVAECVESVFVRQVRGAEVSNDVGA